MCRSCRRVPQAVAARYAAAAAVLVSPRSHGTNTPLKIYEQLASGMPLVATSILSHTQVLDEDVAFLVEPEPQAMADGLIDGACRTTPPASGSRPMRGGSTRPPTRGRSTSARCGRCSSLVGADVRVGQHTLATHGQA